MAEFIFMLTRNDRTIADAQDRLTEVVAAGVRHIGFKDIGLPFDDLLKLAKAIRRTNATLYLEMVSLDETSEVAAAKAALRLDVDVLMGGTRPAAVLPVITGSRVRYYPFAGKVVGHPSKLTGTINEIVAGAKRLADLEGVHGVDLLAYRFDGNVSDLIVQACAAVSKPIIVAGSINCAERVAAVVQAGAAGFTVGTAALDGVFPAPRLLTDQLTYISRLIPATARSDGKAAL